MGETFTQGNVTISLLFKSLSRVRVLGDPHGLEPARLLCPWDFPGENTGMGCHALFQGIFPNQGSNLCLLHWKADSLPLSHLGSPCLFTYLLES